MQEEEVEVDMQPFVECLREMLMEGRCMLHC